MINLKWKEATNIIDKTLEKMDKNAMYRDDFYMVVKQEFLDYIETAGINANITVVNKNQDDDGILIYVTRIWLWNI